MIERAKEIQEPERKQQMVQAIANFMKMAYVTWNKDHVPDETIIKDLREMSNGELELSENVSLYKVEVRPNNQQKQQNKKGRSNKNGGGKHQKNGKRY